MSSDHRLCIRLTPKASSNRVGSLITLDDGTEALQVWVTAPPEDNKANIALLKVLSKHLNVPVSSLKIIKGLTSRIKVIEQQLSPSDNRATSPQGAGKHRGKAKGA